MRALTVGIIVFISSTAAVADESKKFELTPFGGYRFGGRFELANSDDAYELDDSPTSGLILNLRDKANTQWELYYLHQSTDAVRRFSTDPQQDVGINLHVLQIGGTYQGLTGSVHPYLALTLGGTHVKTDAASDTFFSGSLGLGIQINPEARLGLRLEARAHGTLTSSSTDLFCRTGPELNACAARIDGRILSHVETFAGIVFRF